MSGVSETRLGPLRPIADETFQPVHVVVAVDEGAAAARR